MNRDHEIYSAPEKEIPGEDKARLDGYLHGRAEATKLKSSLNREQRRQMKKSRKKQRLQKSKKKHGRQ